VRRYCIHNGAENRKTALQHSRRLRRNHADSLSVRGARGWGQAWQCAIVNRPRYIQIRDPRNVFSRLNPQSGRVPGASPKGGCRGSIPRGGRTRASESRSR
jgi:hypothetical protein